jgi:hypothetical protein
MASAGGRLRAVSDAGAVRESPRRARRATVAVRDRAAEWLAKRVLPGVHFSYGVPSDARWPEERDKADALFVELVRHIDWNRVLIEAQIRHSALHEPDRDFDAVCGECLRKALLIQQSLTSWAVPGEEGDRG